MHVIIPKIRAIRESPCALEGVLLSALAEGLLGLFPAGEEGLEASLGDVGQLCAGIGGGGGELFRGVGQRGLCGVDPVVEFILGSLELSFALLLDDGL